MNKPSKGKVIKMEASELIAVADWVCPSCGRSSLECATFVDSGNLYFRTVTFEDRGANLGQTSRFRPTKICSTCSEFEDSLTKLLGTPLDFSFSPREIRKILTHKVPHVKKHLYFSIYQAMDIFEAAYKGEANSNVPSRRVLNSGLKLPVIPKRGKLTKRLFEWTTKAVQEISNPWDKYHLEYLTACSLRAAGYSLLECWDWYSETNKGAIMEAFSSSGLESLTRYNWITYTPYQK